MMLHPISIKVMHKTFNLVKAGQYRHGVSCLKF